MKVSVQLNRNLHSARILQDGAAQPLVVLVLLDVVGSGCGVLCCRMRAL